MVRSHPKGNPDCIGHGLVRRGRKRVRRVQPDMILAPNVFGGEVLAMALTEEKIDGEILLKRFLDVKPQQS